MLNLLFLYWSVILSFCSCIFAVVGIFFCIFIPSLIIWYLVNLLIVLPVSFFGMIYFNAKNSLEKVSNKE